ncbi:MAG: ABC transporter ATP-binding protein [Candidatus Competibacterales bacterium]
MKAAPSRHDTTLRVENLHAHYGKVHVLQGVDLTVAPGEAVALLGRNGVGKTTTLKAILGLIPRSRGQVRFGDCDLTQLPAHRLAAQGIGYVPQGRGIFPQLSVYENLCIGLTRSPPRERLDYVFQRFPRLQERLSQQGTTLSGGEQQMLAIARCLMMAPRLLVLDEPTEGIMPRLVTAIRREIRLINRRGVAILLVEQNLSMALKLCRKIYLLEKGRVVYQGTGEALRQRPDVVQRYLGLSLESPSLPEPTASANGHLPPGPTERIPS